jgi:hypothetical protein
MPLHDWTKIESGVYHGFHYQWIATMTARLNAGLLPPAYYAAPERSVQGPIPDLITFRDDGLYDNTAVADGGGVATLAKPRKKFVLTAQNESLVYAMRANRIAVKTSKHRVVAVIELISPGNKSGRKPMAKLIHKNVRFLKLGVNVLLIDPFPPGPRDPEGLHPLIWEEFVEEPFVLPPDKPCTMVSYQTRPGLTAYIEPVGLGDPLPDMPLFLKDDFYVDVPLESTYMDTVRAVPRILLPDK